MSKSPPCVPEAQKPDTLYASARDAISGFGFDESVVAVFPDMIKRSVPGYATIIHMVGQIAERFAKPNTNVYDLGCSLGASTLSMRHRIPCADVTIHAVDNSQAMIDQCKAVIDADSGETPVQLHCENIQDTQLANASVCVLNFTQSMAPGGVLILSEKITFEDVDYNQLQIDLHHHFKRTNGYSDLEIAQKRAALENVLLPETLAAHKSRLLNAGFTKAEPWFQCFNFASIIATR